MKNQKRSRLIIFVLFVLLFSSIVASGQITIDDLNRRLELYTQYNIKLAIVETAEEVERIQTKFLEANFIFIYVESENKLERLYRIEGEEEIIRTELPQINAKQLKIYSLGAFERFVDALLPPSSDIWDKSEKKPKIESLKIELEKNDAGNELSLNGMYGNSIDVIIYYPTKYESEDITYSANYGRGGTIELEDHGCVIEFGLIEPDLQETAGGKEVKRDKGSIFVSDRIARRKPESGILLTYSRDKGNLIFYKDKLEVTMRCKGYKDTKRKKILVSYIPHVVFIHGLWADPTDKSYAFLETVYRKRYGDNFHTYNYYLTNVAYTIEQNAELFKQYLLEIIEKGEQDGLKFKPVIVAHSMGGLIAREVAADPYVGSKIGRVITLSTPFMGTSQVNLIFDACPKPTKEECPKYVLFLDSMRRFMTRAGIPPSAGFGEIGPTIKQLTTNNQFINSRENMKPIPEFVLFAGTKPMMPKIVLNIGIEIPQYPSEPTYKTTSTLYMATRPGRYGSIEQKKITVDKVAEWAFKRYYNPPESMIPTFRNFLASLSDPDGTVSPESARWINKKGELVNPDYPRIMVSSTHSGMIRDKHTQKLTFLRVGEDHYTYATVASPVNIYTYDSDGNFVGLKDGVVVNEIENSEFFINETDQVQAVIIEDDEDYSFVIEGTGNGTFGFSVSQKREDKDISVYYENLIVTDTTKAFFNLTKDEEEYLMQVDYDGDGIIDIELEPDFLQVIDIEPKDNYVKGGQIKTDFEKAESKIWIWVFGLVGVIVLLLVLIIIKRKRSSQSI